MPQRVTRRAEMIYNDNMGWWLWWRRHTTTRDIARWHRPTVMSRNDEQQRITTEVTIAKPDLPVYLFRQLTILT